MISRVHENNKYKICMVLFLALLTFPFVFSACSEFKTYSGEIKDAPYSFQHRKSYQVNPPNTNFAAYESFISIISHPGKEIETSLGSYRVKQDPTELQNFKVQKRDIINIAGFPAQYIAYSYEGYTTGPLMYFGQF